MFYYVPSALNKKKKILGPKCKCFNSAHVQILNNSADNVLYVTKWHGNKLPGVFPRELSAFKIKVSVLRSSLELTPRQY